VRALLVLLLCWPLAVFAVDRDLDDCTVGSTPTALAPLDLDNCTISDGDDITGILAGLATTYDDVYVKAPSRSIGVTFTGTVEFGPSGQGADEFKFFEDETHTLRITHIPVTEDATMWRLTNVDAITIGGAGLRLTFMGTHPGLGQGKACSGTREACTANSPNPGMITIELTDSSNPALSDIRANFRQTWGAGIRFVGGDNGSDGESTANRWQQVNVAGVFIGSGVEVGSGVMDFWVDPDRTVVMDPWNRRHGWDGGSTGCFDEARAQTRSPPGIGGNYFRKISGGLTAEYGTPNFNIFVAKYIGNSASDRFLVRIKDYGHSGPEVLTGYPSGIRVKNGAGDETVMKHDPAFVYSFTGPTGRWLEFQQLPSTYGIGINGSSIASGCAVGNSTDNNFPTAHPQTWRAEASADAAANVPYTTAYVDVRFSAFTAWLGASTASTYVSASGSGQDYTDEATDRTFGHVLRVGSGSLIAGAVALLDTNTLTGPGTWYNPQLNGVTATFLPGGTPTKTLYPNDNTITDTNISGFVTVGAGATNTVISNVNFTGTARAVITIGTSADVTATDLCVPDGSTITGTGTLTYDGVSRTLPYTIPNSTANCSITADPRPGPVTGGGVN
jgi:hypothetical protein